MSKLENVECMTDHKIISMITNPELLLLIDDFNMDKE